VPNFIKNNQQPRKGQAKTKRGVHSPEKPIPRLHFIKTESELGHLKDLCQTLLKIISNPEKGRPKQKEGTTAQKNQYQGFTSLRLAVR